MYIVIENNNSSKSSHARCLYSFERYVQKRQSKHDTLFICFFNPFVSNAPFLYPLKTSENETNGLTKKILNDFSIRSSHFQMICRISFLKNFNILQEKNAVLEYFFSNIVNLMTAAVLKSDVLSGNLREIKFPTVSKSEIVFQPVH